MSSEIWERGREKFSALTAFIRDAIWWVAAFLFILGGGLGALAHQFVANFPRFLFIGLEIVGFVGVIGLAVIALYFLRRWRRYVRAELYFHRLTHDLRDNLTHERVKALLAITNPPERMKQLAGFQKELLRDILDNAAQAFRMLTGDERCMSCLLMPAEVDGKEVLQSVMYCSNVHPDRKRQSCPQTAGLAFLVLKSSTAHVYDDYEKELEKGNFEAHRTDWQKWYMSGIMAHFKVGGKPTPWGILNIDCPKRGTFRPDQKELLCAFADACGLVFGLGSVMEEQDGKE